MRKDTCIKIPQSRYMFKSQNLLYEYKDVKQNITLLKFVRAKMCESQNVTHFLIYEPNVKP